jgi:LysR family nitrogen assimilation transcriptional regulator
VAATGYVFAIFALIMSSFELRRLRYFVAVAEFGSVTRAAAELRIAQPALSHQIRLLEDELGGELFTRGPRGVRLTELGDKLLEESRVLLDNLKALRERLRDGANDPEGFVVIGVAQTVGSFLAMPLLELAAKRLPRVRIQIRETMSAHIPDLLREEAIDFALSYDIRSGQGLDAVNLFAEDSYVVGTPAAAERLFGRGNLTELPFAELRHAPLYLSARPNAFRESLERVARSRQIKLRIVAEVDSVVIRKELALSGAGFTVLSGATIRDDLGNRAIFAARLTHPQIRRRICFVRHAGTPLSRAGQAVAVLVSETLAGLATWPGATLPGASGIPKFV